MGTLKKEQGDMDSNRGARDRDRGTGTLTMNKFH